MYSTNTLQFSPFPVNPTTGTKKKEAHHSRIDFGPFDEAPWCRPSLPSCTFPKPAWVGQSWQRRGLPPTTLILCTDSSHSPVSVSLSTCLAAVSVRGSAEAEAMSLPAEVAWRYRLILETVARPRRRTTTTRKEVKSKVAKTTVAGTARRDGPEHCSAWARTPICPDQGVRCVICPGLTPPTLAHIFIKDLLPPASDIFLDYPFLLSDQLISAFLPYLKDPKWQALPIRLLLSTIWNFRASNQVVHALEGAHAVITDTRTLSA
jgi:hypothetical protein